MGAASPQTPCEAIQVGPNKWITPLCGVPEPLPVRAFVEGLATYEGFRRYSFTGGSIGAAPLPPNVDLRRFDGPVRDQGQVGVCWAHALSGVIDNSARQAGLGPVAVSALHVVAKRSFDDLYHNKPSRPLTLEQQWPYHPPKACAFNSSKSEVWCQREYGVVPNSWRGNPQLVAELNRADALHAIRFDNVEKLQNKPGNPAQLASVIASGRAIWADVAIDQRAWSFRALKDGQFDDYAGHPHNGHAIAIVGYRASPFGRQFLIKNSWGRDWAHGGYAWMPEHTLARNLRRAFVLRATRSEGAAPQMPAVPGIGTLPMPTARNPLPIPGLNVNPSTGTMHIPGVGTIPGVGQLAFPATSSSATPLSGSVPSPLPSPAGLCNMIGVPCN